MPRAHGDCKLFRDQWLVQDKYKEWVMKDGDPRIARCQFEFCMKSSKFHHDHPCKQCQLPNGLCSVGAFEKLKLDVGTCACVIHVL